MSGVFGRQTKRLERAHTDDKTLRFSRRRPTGKPRLTCLVRRSNKVRQDGHPEQTNIARRLLRIWTDLQAIKPFDDFRRTPEEMIVDIRRPWPNALAPSKWKETAAATARGQDRAVDMAVKMNALPLPFVQQRLQERLHRSAVRRPPVLAKHMQLRIRMDVEHARPCTYQRNDPLVGVQSPCKHDLVGRPKAIGHVRGNVNQIMEDNRRFPGDVEDLRLFGKLRAAREIGSPRSELNGTYTDRWPGHWPRRRNSPRRSVQ